MNRLLSEKDDNNKYGTLSSDLLTLSAHYKDEPYLTYNNKYKKISNNISNICNINTSNNNNGFFNSTIINSLQLIRLSLEVITFQLESKSKGNNNVFNTINTNNTNTNNTNNNTNNNIGNTNGNITNGNNSKMIIETSITKKPSRKRNFRSKPEEDFSEVINILNKKFQSFSYLILS